MAQDPVGKLATRIADLERQVRGMSTAYQLGRTAFADGTALPDVILASNRAVEAAAQAVKDSSTALAKADGVVNTWYQETAPSGPTVGVGDFWVKSSTRAAYIRVSNGATPPVFSWVAVSDPDVAAALAAAQDAQAAADGKISTWFQASPPTGAGVGDIWYDTDDKNTPYRWNGSSWQLIRDGKVQDALDAAAAADGKATTAINSANGRNRVVYSSSTPSANGTTAGDTWFRIDASGTVLNQYRWSGTAWVEVEPQTVTVAALDAGKITTGTLAAGVTITAGTPGGTRTEINSSGIRAYVGTDLRMSFTGSTSTVIADTFRSANYVAGGVSYVLVGDIGDGTTIDGIKIIRPGNSQVALKNISDSGGGTFQVSLRNDSNVNQGGFEFSTGNIRSMSSFWSLAALAGGSTISGGLGAGLTMSAGSNPVYLTGGWLENTAQYMNFNLPNGGGLRIRPPADNTFGAVVLDSTYSGGALMKFTADQAVQVRTANDGAYTYFRALIQDQSSPELKDKITALEVDAVGLLSTLGFYAWDWKDANPDPENPAPRNSGAGLLLSEMPWVVQPDPDATGYNIGTMIGLLVRAVQQLAANQQTGETT